MVEIKKIRTLRHEDLYFADGYVSTAKYQVLKVETADKKSFTLKRQVLKEPYEKHWLASEDDFRSYSEDVNQGLSFASYDGGRVVGMVIAERIDWNKSMWIREFRVAESHRRKGVGRQMMENVAANTKKEGLRILVCETQSTNVPTIDFYRRVGFEVDGIDLSYYTDSDVEAGEVAILMKRKLE